MNDFACAPPTHQPMVSQKLSELEDAIAHTDNLVERLYAKLDPVCVPATPAQANVGDAPMPQMSSLSMAIHRHGSVVRGLNVKLEALIDMLEV